MVLKQKIEYFLAFFYRFSDTATLFISRFSKSWYLNVYSFHFLVDDEVPNEVFKILTNAKGKDVPESNKSVKKQLKNEKPVKPRQK